jgi:hypothetical protein
MPFTDIEEKRAFQRSWEKKNSKKRVKAKAGRRQTLRERLSEYKSKLKCSRCPETHPACLEFHHRDPKEKDFQLGDMVRLGYGWETILTEIKKCEVLCANCHRKEHANNGA